MEIPWGNILTAIATVAAVVVANNLTLRRSTKEKFWDLRRQAYGVILSELSTVEKICDLADEYIEESDGRYFNSKISNINDAEIGKHMLVAHKRFSDDYLILSEEFIAIYEKLRKKTAASSNPNSIPEEEHDQFSKAIREYRPALLAQARKEVAGKL